MEEDDGGDFLQLGDGPVGDGEENDDQEMTDEEFEEQARRGRGRSESLHERKSRKTTTPQLMTGSAPLPRRTLQLVTTLEATTAGSGTTSPTGNQIGAQEELFSLLGSNCRDAEEERLAEEQERAGRATPRFPVPSSSSASPQRGASTSLFRRSFMSRLAWGGAGAAGGAGIKGRDDSQGTISEPESNYSRGSDRHVSAAGLIEPNSSGAEFDETFKLLLLGDSGTGKTSLLIRMAENNFKPDVLATAGVDWKIRPVSMNGMRIKMQIWDTAGQEKFRMVNKAYYKGAHSIALVFDLTDEQSFGHITGWVQNIRGVTQNGNTIIPIILIGNKVDCSDNQRKVSNELAMKMAKEFGILYYETSARTGQNVSEVLEAIAKGILEKKNAEKHSSSSSGATAVSLADTNKSKISSDSEPSVAASPTRGKADNSAPTLRPESKQSASSTPARFGLRCSIM